MSVGQRVFSVSKDVCHAISSMLWYQNSAQVAGFHLEELERPFVVALLRIKQKSIITCAFLEVPLQVPLSRRAAKRTSAAVFEHTWFFSEHSLCRG